MGVGREVPGDVKPVVLCCGGGTLCYLSLRWCQTGGKVTIDFILPSGVLRSTGSPEGSHLASCSPVLLGPPSLSQPPLSFLLLGPEVPQPFYSQAA